MAEDKKPSFKLYTLSLTLLCSLNSTNQLKAPNFEGSISLKRCSASILPMPSYSIFAKQVMLGWYRKAKWWKMRSNQQPKMVETFIKPWCQTIAIATCDPLPAGRWDKYMSWPCLSTCQKKILAQRRIDQVPNPNWTTEINKETGKVIFHLTDDYLDLKSSKATYSSKLPASVVW